LTSSTPSPSKCWTCHFQESVT